MTAAEESVLVQTLPVVLHTDSGEPPTEEQLYALATRIKEAREPEQEAPIMRK